MYGEIYPGTCFILDAARLNGSNLDLIVFGHSRRIRQCESLDDVVFFALEVLFVLFVHYSL